MSEFEQLVSGMSVSSIARLMKACLKQLVKSGKRPIRSSSYKMGLDFERGVAAFSDFQSWDTVDDMMPLLPRLKELVSILELRENQLGAKSE